MTQVFAAINHRLSEEFSGIDLPSIEAKERYDSVLPCTCSLIFMHWRRLLADARYLHEKLSALKNVRDPTAMLEIVVQEKRVEVKSASPPPAAAPSPTPAHATTSRFAHMFARAESLKLHRSTTPTPSPPVDTEKALPVIDPVETAVFEPTPVANGGPSPRPSRATTPIPNGNGNANGNGSITAGDLVDEPQDIEVDERGHDGSTLSPLPVKADLVSSRPGSRASSPHPGSRPNSRPGSRVASPQPLLPSEILRAQKEGNLEEELFPETEL